MKRELCEVNNKCLKEFQNIFMDSYDKFIRYACAILEDRQTAQDVVQEAFLFAYEEYKNHRDISRIIPYIYDFIRNECMSYLKAKSVEKKRGQIYREPLAVNMTIPEELILKKEIQHKVVDIINKLDPSERRIVILKYYCKLSVKEIASSLGTNADDITVILTKIKQRIAKELNND